MVARAIDFSQLNQDELHRVQARRPERARHAPAASCPTGSETAGRPTRLASVAKRITALSSGRSDAPHFRSCGLRPRAPALSPPPHRLRAHAG